MNSPRGSWASISASAKDSQSVEVGRVSKIGLTHLPHRVVTHSDRSVWHVFEVIERFTRPRHGADPPLQGAQLD